MYEVESDERKDENIFFSLASLINESTGQEYVLKMQRRIPVTTTKKNFKII